MKARLVALAVLAFAGMPALAHRLDEYLQGTLISVEKSRLRAQITLTPGVAVLPAVLADIDANRDGVISEAEQSAYVGRVIHDLSLTIDGRPLTLQLLFIQFPAIEQMKVGRGEIQIEFGAELPPGGSSRALIFKNDHQPRIAAYQVNCLVPRDPNIRIVAQSRNYLQSLYQMEFEQAGVPSDHLSSAWRPGDLGWFGTAVLFLFVRFAWFGRQRAKQKQNRVTGRPHGQMNF